MRLGNHGYRIDGDVAFLQADLHIPPHFSGSDLALELWACAAPHSGGNPHGTRVAAIPLELPTPIAPHTHRVESRTAASFPTGNGDHAMVLMLVSGGDGRVHDFANYGRLEHFANPSLEGAVGYSVDGEQVVLRAEGVANPRPTGNTSGTLSLELWALAEPYAGGAPRGQRLGTAELGSVWGQYRLPAVERRVPFTPPAPGRWHLSLLLREWTLAHGYSTRDYRNFEARYEQPAPERVAAAAPAPADHAPALVAPASASRASEKLRLLEPGAEVPAAARAPSAAAAVSEPAAPAPVAAAPAPVAAAAAAPTPAPVAAAPAPAAAAPAPVAPAATAPVAAQAAPVSSAGKPGLLSVHTASIEELSKLPGLSLKVAKEIVKARPYASLEALLEVRGIGDKTLRRIKNLLTL